MLAIIKTGGKQYIVKEGTKLRVEKLDGDESAAVKFDEVLALGDDNEVHLGAPVVSGALVEGKILSHGRHKKVTGVKFKPKKRYKVKFGHRQAYTEVEIAKIVGSAQ